MVAHAGRARCAQAPPARSPAGAAHRQRPAPCRATNRSAARGSGAKVRAALVLRDNVRNRALIEKPTVPLAPARHEVIIANAYHFVPGRKLRKALLMAARRACGVRLLLQGVMNHFMQYHAARPVYGGAAGGGVEITNTRRAFLHAKVAVVDALGDRPWATVGSSNLDPRACCWPAKANVVVEDAAFACDLRQRLVHAMQHAGRRMDPPATPVAPCASACSTGWPLA